MGRDVNDGKMLVRERARGTVSGQKKRASEKLRRKGLTYCRLFASSRMGKTMSNNEERVAETRH